MITYELPRLLIYTDTHFMWAFVNEGDPRPMLPAPAETTDGQLARVARQYQSTAGTYIRDGATIRYNRMIDLIPNNMQRVE